MWSMECLIFVLSHLIFQAGKTVFILHLGGQVVLDDGWLVGVSELHLQLGTCCKPISIDTLPEDTQFSVKIQPFCSSAKKVCAAVYSPHTHTHTQTHTHTLTHTHTHTRTHTRTHATHTHTHTHTQHTHTQDVVHSPIKAKKLSRVEGDCTRLEQGESGCRFDQNINLLVFHTQSPDFSHCVS